MKHQEIFKSSVLFLTLGLSLGAYESYGFIDNHTTEPKINNRPALKDFGLSNNIKRLGRGRVREVIALNQELTVVIAHRGATLFNLATGEALWEIDCPAVSGAMSADRRLLALASNKDIYLWDLTSGKFLRQLTGHKYGVWSVSFSADGETLASGSGDNVLNQN